MKFIVDAQVFQTNTWHRGMGKYSLELLKALQNNGFFDKYQLEIVLNANLTFDSDRRQLFEKTFSSAVFTELNLQTTNAINLQKVQNYNRRQLNEVYDDSSDIFFIPSLFENKVTPVFPTRARKIVLTYDLIPLYFLISFHCL